MRRTAKLTLSLLVPVFALSNLPALAGVDSPEALEANHRRALQLIQAGDRLGAARLLLDSLSALPRDRADLALPAVGAVQLLTFTHEYLMTDEERQALYSGSLDEEHNEMHRFLATLMRYVESKHAISCCFLCLGRCAICWAIVFRNRTDTAVEHVDRLPPGSVKYEVGVKACRWREFCQVSLCE